MPLLTPNVPKGLIDLMKSLTKEVLRDKPENIYEYAAVHFEKQLCERDGSLDKDYELFTDYKASFEGQQQFLVPPCYGFKCQRTPRGSGSRRSKPDILASFKVMESIHEEDASAENLYSDEKYQKAIYVIQRYYRRYKARKKTSASTDRPRLTEATAAIIIQRTMRKLFANKFPSRPGGETVRHGEAPQEDVDNVSEAASYTSSSTIQMLPDSQEGRENRLTSGREEIADDNGDGEGDGSTTTVTHEPSAASQNHHIVAAKETQEVDGKSMDHENDESDLLPLEESSANPLAAIVSDDTSTAPIGILSTKIGSNDQLNSLQTNTVEVAKNSKNIEPTQVETPQDVTRVEMHSLGSTPEIPPVAPPCRQSAEKTFAVRLQSNAFVDNNAGYSVPSVGPNRKFAADTGDSMKAYSVFYQDGDDPDFSDSLNESTMEKDSLETEDLDVDSLESNDNTSHVSGIVKREIMRVPDDRRDGGACEDEEQQNEQLLGMERVPSYLYGIHPKRTPLPERKSVQSRTAPDGENLGPDEKSEEESLESKESTSEESSATQIENILEPRIDALSSTEHKLEALNTNESDKKEANPPKAGAEDAGKKDVSNETVAESSPSSSGVCASNHDDHAKLGYFETLYNVDDTMQSPSGHQDSEVESQLKDLRSLCNLYPGLEIKDIISEFHTKHIQPGECGKESVYDDNNNVEDFEMKLSDTNTVDEDEEDLEALEALHKVDGSVERAKSVVDKEDPIHSIANETVNDVPKEEESVNPVSTEVEDVMQVTAKVPSSDKNCIVNAEGEVPETKVCKNSSEATEQNDGPVCEERMNEPTNSVEASNQQHGGELAKSEMSNETDINNFKDKEDQTASAYQEESEAERKRATIDKDLISSSSHELSEVNADVPDVAIHEDQETEYREMLDSKPSLREDKIEDKGTLELVKTSEITTEAKARRVTSENNLDGMKEAFEDKENKNDGDTKCGETGNTEGKVIDRSDQPSELHEAEQKDVVNSDVDSTRNHDGLEEGRSSNEAKADKSIKLADTSEGDKEIEKSELTESLDESGERDIVTTGGSEEVKDDDKQATDSLSEEQAQAIGERSIGTTGGSEEMKGDAKQATDSLSEVKAGTVEERIIGTTGGSEKVKGDDNQATDSLSEEQAEAIEGRAIGTTGGSEEMKGDAKQATDSLSEVKAGTIEERIIGTTGGSEEVKGDAKQATDRLSEVKVDTIEERIIGTTGGSEEVKGDAKQATDSLSEVKVDTIEERIIGTTGGSEEVKGDANQATDSLSEVKAGTIEERIIGTTDGSEEVKGDANQATDSLSKVKAGTIEERIIGTTDGSEKVKGDEKQATDSLSEVKMDTIEERIIGTTGGSEDVKGDANQATESLSEEQAEAIEERAIGTTGGSEEVKGDDKQATDSLSEAKVDTIKDSTIGTTGGSEEVKGDASEATHSFNAESTDKEGSSSNVEFDKDNIPKEQELKSSLNESADPTTDRNQSENVKKHDVKEEPIVKMKLDEVEGQLIGNKDTETEMRSVGDSLKESKASDAQIGETSVQIVESQEKRNTKNTEIGGAPMGGPKIIDSSEKVIDSEAKEDEIGITGGSMESTEGGRNDLNEEDSEEPQLNASNSESVFQGKADAQVGADSNDTEDVREETRLAEETKSSEVENVESVEMEGNVDVFGDKTLDLDLQNSKQSDLEECEQENLRERDPKTDINMNSSEELQETSGLNEGSLTNSVNVTSETNERNHENVNTLESNESETTDNRDSEAELSEIVLQTNENDDTQTTSSSVTIGETSPDEDNVKNVNSEAEAAEKEIGGKRNLVQKTFASTQPREIVDSEYNKNEEGLANSAQLTSDQSDHFNDLPSMIKEENPTPRSHLEQTQNKERMDETGLTGVLRSFKGDAHPREVEEGEAPEEADQSLAQNGAKDSIEETGLTGVLRSLKGDARPREVEEGEAPEEADQSLAQNGAKNSIEETGLTGVLRSFKGDAHPREVEEGEAPEEADKSLTQGGAKDSIEETGLTGVLRSFKGGAHPRDAEMDTTEEAEKSLQFSTNNKSDTQQKVDNIDNKGVESADSQISNEDTALKVKQNLDEIGGSNLNGTEYRTVEKMEAVESYQSRQPLVDMGSTTGTEAHEVATADVKRNKRSLSNGNFNEEYDDDTTVGRSDGLGEQSEELGGHSQDQENDPSLVETALVRIVISHVDDARNEDDLVNGEGYKLSELSDQENRTLVDRNDSGKGGVKTEGSSLQSATEKLDDANESGGGVISESHVSVMENKNETLNEEGVECEESLPSEAFDVQRTDGHSQEDEKWDTGNPECKRSRHVATDNDEVPNERCDFIDPARLNAEEESKQAGNDNKVDGILSANIPKSMDEFVEKTVDLSTKDGNQERNATGENVKETVKEADSADKCEVENTKEAEEQTDLQSKIESSNGEDSIQQKEQITSPLEEVTGSEEVKACVSEDTESTPKQDLTETLMMSTLEDENKIDSLTEQAADVNEDEGPVPGTTPEHNEKQQEVNDESLDDTNEKGTSSTANHSDNVLDSEMRSKKDESSEEAGESVVIKKKTNELTLSKMDELEEDASRGIVVSKIDVLKEEDQSPRGIRETVSVSGKEEEENDDHNPLQSVDNRREDLKTESKELKIESKSTEEAEQNISDDEKRTSTESEEKLVVPCEIERHLPISDGTRDHGANDDNDPETSENDDKTLKTVEDGSMHEDTNLEASSERAAEDDSKNQDHVGKNEPKGRTVTNDSEGKTLKEGDTEVVSNETTLTSSNSVKDDQTPIISSKNPAPTRPQPEEDHDKSTSQAGLTANCPSTEVTGVDENTAETSADFSSIGKDMDFFEDTIHYLKSATTQLTAIEGLFDKTITDENANANTLSKTEENLNKAAVVIQSAIRGYRVRRAFKRNLSSGRQKSSVETEGASSIPVAIIHPTKHVTEDEKDVGEQATGTKLDDGDNAQHIVNSGGRSETRSEIPRLKRERPLERKTRPDESAAYRMEAKIHPTKANSLEETQRAKPRLTREKPIERNPRSVKGDSLDETTRKETTPRQKTPSAKDKTKMLTSRVVSSSNVPERHRLIKSKRDQFAKKGKSLSTNAQTQKPLVFDLEAIKKDLLTKKTVSQAGKKPRVVAKKEPAKGKDSSKRETGPVDKLDGTSVLSKSRQSSALDKKDKLEKDSVFQELSVTTPATDRRVEDVTSDGKTKNCVELGTVEKLVQEALIDQVEEVAQGQPELANEFHDKSDKLSGEVTEDNLNATSNDTDIDECKNETSKTQTEPEDRTDEEKREGLNEQSQDVESDSLIKGTSRGVSNAKPSADGSSDSLDTGSKAQVPETGIGKDEEDVLNKTVMSQIVIYDATAVVDANKEDKVEDSKKDQFEHIDQTESPESEVSELKNTSNTIVEDEEMGKMNEKEETPTSTGITAVAQQSSKNDGKAFFVTDAVAGVDQITELESKLSKDDNGGKDEVQITSSMSKVISTQQEDTIVKREDSSDKDLNSIQQSVATEETQLKDHKDLNQSAPSRKEETEQLTSQSQHGSKETIQRDLNKPATIIQKTFRGYNTRKTLNNQKPAENRNGDDQELYKSTELHDSLTRGTDSISNSRSVLDTSATVVRTRRSLKDVSEADAEETNPHSPNNSQSMPSVELVESQKLGDSAVMIQKTYRGYKTRKELRDETKSQEENEKAMNEAAIVIQKRGSDQSEDKTSRDLGGIQENDRDTEAEFKRGSDQSEEKTSRDLLGIQENDRDIDAQLKRGSDQSEDKTSRDLGGIQENDRDTEVEFKRGSDQSEDKTSRNLGGIQENDRDTEAEFKRGSDQSEDKTSRDLGGIQENDRDTEVEFKRGSDQSEDKTSRNLGGIKENDRDTEAEFKRGSDQSEDKTSRDLGGIQENDRDTEVEFKRGSDQSEEKTSRDLLGIQENDRDIDAQLKRGSDQSEDKTSRDLGGIQENDRDTEVEFKRGSDQSEDKTSRNLGGIQENDRDTEAEFKRGSDQSEDKTSRDLGGIQENDRDTEVEFKRGSDQSEDKTSRNLGGIQENDRDTEAEFKRGSDQSEDKTSRDLGGIQENDRDTEVEFKRGSDQSEEKTSRDLLGIQENDRDIDAQLKRGSDQSEDKTSRDLGGIQENDRDTEVEFKRGSDQSEDKTSRNLGGIQENDRDTEAEFKRGSDQSEDKTSRDLGGIQENDRDTEAEFKRGSDQSEDKTSRDLGGIQENDRDTEVEFKRGSDQSEDKTSRDLGGIQENDRDTEVEFKRGSDQSEDKTSRDLGGIQENDRDTEAEFKRGSDQSEDKTSRNLGGIEENDRDTEAEFKRGSDQSEDKTSRDLGGIQENDRDTEVEFKRGSDQSEDKTSRNLGGIQENDRDTEAEFKRGSDQSEDKTSRDLGGIQENDRDTEVEFKRGSDQSEEKTSRDLLGIQENDRDIDAQLKRGSDQSEDKTSRDLGGIQENDRDTEVEFKRGSDQSEDKTSRNLGGIQENDRDTEAEFKRGSDQSEDKTSRDLGGIQENDRDTEAEFKRGSDQSEDKNSRDLGGIQENDRDTEVEFKRGSDQSEDKTSRDLGGIQENDRDTEVEFKRGSDQSEDKTSRDLGGIQENDRDTEAEFKRGSDQSEDKTSRNLGGIEENDRDTEAETDHSEVTREEAATLIQKTYKGYKTRVDLKKSQQRDCDDSRHLAMKKYDTFEPSLNANAAPHTPSIHKSTSADALLESAAETIPKAFGDYHGQKDNSCNGVPIKSYSHGAKRDHACKEAVENSDESSIFMGPDTSFDLSDVESVETKSEQVSDTATFTLQDESFSEAPSKTPEEPQRDIELQPEHSSLSVESGIRRKRSIIEPTAPALEDILKSDEPPGPDSKPQWYVGDDLIVPTEPSTSQQNSLDSTSSCRFDNSCSTDARLDISDKQPTPSIQSAVVSTSSLLFPNDAEMHDSDSFKQLNTKPSRAVSADEEESSAREDEAKEKEIEENAEEQKLDADTARDGSGSSEKGERECNAVLGADPFSVVIKIEDLGGLPMDNVREIEAEVCKSCAEGMHGAGLTTASPRRKSIEEISREIDEQATNLGDTKDADAADDSADGNLDKIEQFVLMEETNKANITESHTDDQSENINDNNCNKSHNDADLAGLDKMNIKDASSDSKISGIPSEGKEEQKEAFVENALEENGHEGAEQGECPAITLMPPSSEDDVSDKGVSDGEAKEGLSEKTDSGAHGDDVTGQLRGDVSPSDQGKGDEQGGSTELREPVKVDKSDKVSDEAEAHKEESGENASSTVDKKSENDIPQDGSDVKELDESNNEAREVSLDLKTDVETQETPQIEVQTMQSLEVVDKENSKKDPTDTLKETEPPVTPNDEGLHEKMEDSSSSSHEINLKNDDGSNKSTDQNNDDACLKKIASEDQTEGVADSVLCADNEKSLEMPLSEDKGSVSLKDEKSDENQSKAASDEPTGEKTSDEQSEKLDSSPSTKHVEEVDNVNSPKEQSQATPEHANNGPVQDETKTLQPLEKSSQDQEPQPAEQVASPTQENSSVSEQKDDLQSPASTLEANLEKLIDDSSPLTETDSIRVEPHSLPTENSSQEVVEEPCIKKVVPSSSEQEDSEIESTTTKAESTTTSVAYDEASENETLDSPPSLHDPLEKATEALRESEAVVARMHLRRDSEQKASLDHVDQFPVFGDIACEPIKSMQELQKPSSPEVEDDIILQGLQRGDTTRESSAQSESIVFGNSSTQLSESEDFFNENADIKSMHRMNTIAGDHGTYRAPSVLFKSVTIDDTVKYIDPEKSTEESGDSFGLDDALTADVRKKMMAYSVSEADSDYYEPGLDRQQDDFNISTALNKFASSDTDTTIVSAATKIQAGARGFLTRRRLRRASMGTRASLTDGAKASFGNDAIGESLDRLVEEEANKRLPKVHYQRQVGVNSLPSALGNAEEPEIVHSTPTQDELSTLTATTELLAPSSANTTHGEARYSHSLSTSSEYDVNGVIGASIDESSEALSSNLEATLAARRLTLQRGDAMRNDSTPDSDNGNDKQVEQAKITTANTDAILIHESTLLESTTATNTEQRAHSDAAMVRKMEKIKWFAMRQNSMPVQIDSEVFRVLPKHMRKRIKSAEGQQKKRIRLPRD